MKLKIYLLIVMLVLAVSGCSKHSKITGQEYVDVNGFFESYMDAFNNRDLNNLMAHYAPTSLTYVLTDAEGYYMTKADLLKAFEMKVKGWDERDLRLTGFKVINTSGLGTQVTVDVEFKVNSSSWVGEYRVKYAVDKISGAYQIVKENL